MTTMIEELPVIVNELLEDHIREGMSFLSCVVNRKIWMSAFEKGEEKKDYFSISVLLKLKGCLQ